MVYKNASNQNNPRPHYMSGRASPLNQSNNIFVRTSLILGSEELNMEVPSKARGDLWMLGRIEGDFYRGVSGGDAPIEIHQRAKSGLVQTILPVAFRVVISPEEGGGFSAFSPDLVGARTQGETEDEVIHNMAEAVELVLEARGTVVPFVLRLPDSK